MNLLACGLYYVCQAAGVGIAALLFAKRPAIASGRALPFYTSIAMVACLGIAVFSPSAGVVIAASTLLNLMIGVLSALYLTRLPPTFRISAAGSYSASPMLSAALAHGFCLCRWMANFSGAAKAFLP